MRRQESRGQQQGGGSPHDDRSSEHVHSANEPDLTGTLRREIDDDWFIEWQRAPKVQRGKHHFGAARFVGGPKKGNPRRFACSKRQRGRLVALLSDQNFSALRFARAA